MLNEGYNFMLLKNKDELKKIKVPLLTLAVDAVAREAGVAHAGVIPQVVGAGRQQGALVERSIRVVCLQTLIHVCNRIDH